MMTIFACNISLSGLDDINYKEICHCNVNKGLLKKQCVCALFFSLMDVEKSESLCWSSISPEPSPPVTEEPQ